MNYSLAKSFIHDIEIDHEDEHPLVKVPNGQGPAIVMSSQQAVVKHGRKIEVAVGANPQPATNVLVVGGKVNFNLAAYPSFLYSLTLAIRCSESGGTNTVTMCPGFNTFSTVKIYSGNKSKLLQTLTSDSILLEYASLSQEALASIAAAGNFSSSFGAGTAIAASGTATYYVPLLGSLFNQAGPSGFWMGNLQGDIVVEIEFVPSVESGTGTLAVSSLQLLADYDVLTEEEAAHYRLHYAANPQRYRILDTVTVSQTANTLAASTAYTVELKSLIGPCAAVLPVLRANGYSNTSGGKRTFTTWGPQTTFQMLDSNNNPAHQDQPRTSAKLRYIDAPQLFNGRAFVDLAITPIVFSNPQSWKGGHIDEYYPQTANDKLKITTDSSFTGATYAFDIVALMWRYVDRQPNGYMDVSQ